MQGRELAAMLPVSQIEQLYTQLGRAYERNAEGEKARAAYTALLTYAQEASQPVLEQIARTHLEALASQ